jgi:hypothetical protein
VERPPAGEEVELRYGPYGIEPVLELEAERLRDKCCSIKKERNRNREHVRASHGYGRKYP